jgi:DNA-binding NarL/FixJ family response regulator
MKSGQPVGPVFHRMLMGLPRGLLADDHSEMLEQVTRLLEGVIEIVETVDNGQKLVEAVSQMDPDLIVLDISMPILNGIEAARRLKNSGSQAKFIFLTMYEDQDFLVATRLAGALGYVLKHRISTDLIPAVHHVLQGREFSSLPLRAP